MSDTSDVSTTGGEPGEQPFIKRGKRRADLSTRRSPQQTRSVQTVAAILEAANQELMAGGLERLTTNRIAETAGLAVGTVYGYFPNKESIVAALVSRWFNAIYEGALLIHPEAEGPKDLMSYLSVSVTKAIEFYEAQPGVGSLLATIPSIPELAAEERGHDQRISACVASALTHFAPNADPREVAAVAKSFPQMVHAIALQVLDADVDMRPRLIKYLRISINAMAAQLLIQG